MDHSILANPNKTDKDGTRDEVIPKYKNYFEDKIKTNNNYIKELLSVKNKNLCY